MKRLGVEALGKDFDLVGINPVGLAQEALTDGEIFEIEFVHMPSLRSDPFLR